MKDYRLYILDPFSGHIADVREFAAADDAEASATAVRMTERRPIELWHHHHKLRHWDDALTDLD